MPLFDLDGVPRHVRQVGARLANVVTVEPSPTGAQDVNRGVAPS